MPSPFVSFGSTIHCYKKEIELTTAFTPAPSQFFHFRPLITTPLQHRRRSLIGVCGDSLIVL